MHKGIMPLCGMHPAQETNQNASALFVSYKKAMPPTGSMAFLHSPMQMKYTAKAAHGARGE